MSDKIGLKICRYCNDRVGKTRNVSFLKNLILTRIEDLFARIVLFYLGIVRDVERDVRSNR